MNLNRSDFIYNFTNYFNYDNDRKFYHFNIFTKSADDDLEFNENLNLFFQNFFIDFKIKNGSKILKNLYLDKNFDYDYSEEHPDPDDLCCFNCYFNINLFFDLIISENSNNIDNLKHVFRIENKFGNGLYDTFFASQSVDLSIHPAPIDDSNFDGIFDKKHNDFKYQKNWYFGFSNLDDLKSWCINQETIDKLIKEKCIIKEYLIDENFVIQGDKQLIFQKNKVKSFLIKDYDFLYNKKHKYN